jgi:hypothetical protein
MLEVLMRYREDVRFLLDSGAFTAFMAGKTVNLKDYEAFVKSLKASGVDVWRYFTLDVIGDPEATRVNYDTLRERGLNPVPIFTRGESLDSLDEYYETSDVVAIGGLVGTNDPAGFVNGVMKHIGNRRTHWLGFTRKEFLKHYRPYMCDCSSFSETARYGWLNLYRGNGLWHPTLSRADFVKPPSPQLEATLRDYNVTARDLSKASAWKGHTLAQDVSLMSWARWQLDLQIHLNVQLFFSVGSPVTLEELIKHYLYWKKRVCRPV